MSEQLGLFHDLTLWSYHRGLPDRESDPMSKYTHLIMWYGDPEESLGRGFKRGDDGMSTGEAVGREVDHWKRTFSVEEYKKKIIDLMKDGEPRTFNCICIELTGTTANVWFEKEPDTALWQLVEEEVLAWTCGDGATFFIDSNFVNWDAT